MGLAFLKQVFFLLLRENTFFDDDESRGSEGELLWRQLCTYMKTPPSPPHIPMTPPVPPSGGWEQERSCDGRQSWDSG